MLLAWMGCAPGEATFTPSDVIGVGEVRFPARPGKVHVEYGTGLEGGRTRPGWAVDGSVPVYGLVAGETYQFEVVYGDGTRLAPIEAQVPSPPADAPVWTASGSDNGCDPDSLVLVDWVAAETSGVAVIDRQGRYRWAVVNADPGFEVGRARLGRDGASVVWNVVDRARDFVDGAILRRSLDGRTLTRTAAYWAHDDFVELPGQRFAWLALERSQPDDGGSATFLATDGVFEAAEGAQERVVGMPEGQVFSTLGDYKQGVYRLPDEGRDGASVPGCDEFGRAESLAYREGDDRLFLMWRFVDTLIPIERATGEVDWEWGGWYSSFDLPIPDSFEHARFSDVWDGGVLVFDNRAHGASRLREYAFDDAGAELGWSWEGTDHVEDGGDVRRVPGCDDLLVTWPSAGSRVFELARDGRIVWEVRSEDAGVVVRRAEVVPAW